ncbi:carbohydrate ABC transporter permease [Mesorhizobium sp. VK24D]|uniref:Carbohydrate ABC transporter permease n=1 Tax=Mesorhizobium album TaxID=3072314 RepID=A0ABU4Y6K6_9HYPH|nr:carbohydrate ABC transporter permease [Mesorhizobium sp. VK24D]MDX8482566.1 carbohydrate ABC transporter permease [Mesorhizobium sp. VK24D]
MSEPKRFLGEPVPAPRLAGQTILVNLLLAVFGLFFVLPMLWLVLASVDAAASQQFKLPELTLQQFALALEPDKIQALVNSLIVSLIATVVATVPSTIAAYSFSRHRIPGKQGILLGIVFLSGVPISILIIPIYQLFEWADLLSLMPTGVFLGATAIPFEIYVIKNAIDAIPVDLEEAARIEQAGMVRILLRVVGPLCLPGIMAAAIYGFINTWGNFLPPLVLVSDTAQQPSPVEIYSFMTNNVINYGAIAAYSLIYTLPIILLYVAASRLFRGGFALGGAVK